jgi:hypothetical protein
MQPYPNSDGASFKLLSKYVGEDKNYIYFLGNQLTKKDIGVEYNIDDSRYPYKNILLYSKQLVYLDGRVLDDIDVPSFEILSHYFDFFVKPFAGKIFGAYKEPLLCENFGMIKHCRDKYGEFILRNYDLSKEPYRSRRLDNPWVMERITSLEDYISNNQAAIVA